MGKTGKKLLEALCGLAPAASRHRRPCASFPAGDPVHRGGPDHPRSGGPGAEASRKGAAKALPGPVREGRRNQVRPETKVRSTVTVMVRSYKRALNHSEFDAKESGPVNGPARRRRMKKTILIALGMVLLMATFSAPEAQQTKKIAILPFTVNSS